MPAPGTKRTSKASEVEKCFKRIRSAEPDVKVIVGGKVFLHYSQELALNSEYFDAMLSSDMKEGQTKVIEFPDKSPYYWEKVYKFMSNPAAVADFEHANIRELIPWFSELRMTEWFNRCDIFMDKAIKEEIEEYDDLEGNRAFDMKQTADEKVHEVLQYLLTSVTYQLKASMETGLEFIESLLPDSFCFFSQKSVAVLISILKHQDAQSRLWDKVRPLLSTKVQRMEVKELLESPLLEPLLLQKAMLAFIERHGEETHDNFYSHYF